MKENERLKCPYCFFCVEKSQLDPFWYVVLFRSVVSSRGFRGERWVRLLPFSKKCCSYFPPKKVQKWVHITFAARQIALFDLDRTLSPSDTPIPIGSHSFSIGSHPFPIGSHPFLTESHSLKKILDPPLVVSNTFFFLTIEGFVLISKRDDHIWCKWQLSQRN